MLDVALHAVASLALFYLLRIIGRRLPSKSKNSPFPPGPKRLPLIGSLLQMPSTYFWLTYTKWARVYGDIVYTSVCGNQILLLNSAEVVFDLLDKRSMIYSDRPQLPMLELMGYSWQFPLMNYGPTLRLQRKLLHQHFSQHSSQKYIHILEDETLKTLKNLIKDPNGLDSQIRRFFSSSIFRVIYGLELRQEGDPSLSLAEEIMEGEIIATVPGAFLVDMIPILKYIPAWFPGANFKRIANRYRSRQDLFRNKPVVAVQRAMELGAYQTSIVSELLTSLYGVDAKQAGATNEDMLRSIKDATSVAFLGGLDTTVSALEMFVLCMLLFPEVQNKAHLALVKVIGRDRLPETNEIESIPYIHAVMRSFAHCTNAHDEYQGYHIPKGCIVLPNVWAISHDESVYPDPFSFQPERFLSANGSLLNDTSDPLNYAFGFGRRVCPGKHHAYNSVMILIASLIAAFEIVPCDDSPLPKPEELTPENMSLKLVESGVITHPRPYRCKLIPRSDVISKQLMD